ncbi:MAG: hypothetical protein KF819_39585 [Labilithrix sp.]|nr:hypothetical protein [Labilithrix sp.]
MKKRMQRARARARGAVFVESIVVVSFFTLCFLGVVYFRELYLAKMRVQRLARASAMAHALSECRGDPRAGLEGELPAKPIEGSVERGQSRTSGTNDKIAGDALDKFERSRDGAPLHEITSIRLTTRAEAMTRPDPTSKPQGFESDVSSTSFVTCADPVSDDQYAEIVPRMVGVFDSFF